MKVKVFSYFLILLILALVSVNSNAQSSTSRIIFSYTDSTNAYSSSIDQAIFSDSAEIQISESHGSRLYLYKVIIKNIPGVYYIRVYLDNNLQKQSYSIKAGSKLGYKYDFVTWSPKKIQNIELEFIMDDSYFSSGHESVAVNSSHSPINLYAGIGYRVSDFINLPIAFLGVEWNWLFFEAQGGFTPWDYTYTVIYGNKIYKRSSHVSFTAGARWHLSGILSLDFGAGYYQSQIINNQAWKYLSRREGVRLLSRLAIGFFVLEGEWSPGKYDIWNKVASPADYSAWGISLKVKLFGF